MRESNCRSRHFWNLFVINPWTLCELVHLVHYASTSIDIALIESISIEKVLFIFDTLVIEDHDHIFKHLPPRAQDGP
jgi:hypothetical protein